MQFSKEFQASPFSLKRCPHLLDNRKAISKIRMVQFILRRPLLHSHSFVPISNHYMVTNKYSLDVYVEHYIQRRFKVYKYNESGSLASL